MKPLCFQGRKRKSYFSQDADSKPGILTKRDHCGTSDHRVGHSLFKQKKEKGGKKMLEFRPSGETEVAERFVKWG